MITIKLPAWSECEERVDAQEATATEKFIYDFESGGNSKEWRYALRRVIEDVLMREANIRAGNERL